MAARVEASDYAELIGVVLGQEGDRDSHHPVVVAWDRVRERNLDGVKVVVGRVADSANFLVFAELDVVRHGHQL